MNKTIILYLFFCLTSIDWLPAQTISTYDILHETYHTLLQRPNVRIDSVKYTGDDREKSGGFVWQRGSGSGWTTGCRLTLHNVNTEEVKQIRDRFESLSSQQHVNLNHSYSAATYIDSVKTIYLYSYESQSQTLYYLKAHTDGEVSVPSRWTQLNFMDASSANPFAQAGETELRLLGLSRLWAEAKRNFVFMHRVNLNWDSLYVVTIPVISQAKDRDECFFILQRMAAQLADGHTYVYGDNPIRATVPVATVLIDNHVYVDEIQSSILYQQGLRRGMELISINGESAFEYGEKHVMPYVSSSTPQWTLHETYEGSNLLGGGTQDTLNLVFSSTRNLLSLSYIMGSATRDLPTQGQILSLGN